MSQIQSQPFTPWQTIGQIKIHSGHLRLVDPIYLLHDDSAKSGCDIVTPNGTFDAQIAPIDIPHHGTYVSQFRILIDPTCTPTTQINKCDVDIDSAMVVALDAANIEPHWVCVGSKRQASLIGTDKPQIAALLQQHGFALGKPKDWATPFINPLSPVDEMRAQQLIHSHNLKGLITVKTGNSYDQIVDAMQATDHLYATLPFPTGGMGLAVAVSTGTGDGGYQVIEHHSLSGLCAIEIDFRPDYNPNLGM